jgi:hypothetical protein
MKKFQSVDRNCSSGVVKWYYKNVWGHLTLQTKYILFIEGTVTDGGAFCVACQQFFREYLLHTTNPSLLLTGYKKKGEACEKL